jgi:hypothetical protein
MKNVTTLLVLCCFSAAAFGQTPFTITYNNFPFYSTQNYQGPNTGSNLTPTANGNWNYSTLHTTASTSSNYYVETDPFYTSAGVNVYIDDFKNLTSALGYIIYNEFDFNNSGVYDKGIYVDAQAYGLGALSGNNLDSIRFPLQGYIYPTARKVMQFPATFQTAWTSQNRRWVNFDLSVAAVGLNKTPGQHVFTTIRTDSIAGWGKMRVYSNGSPSIQYDVLINKSYQYAVDSFFLGGAPAPPALLTAFGLTQGQQTGINKRYTVFREGYSTPLAVFLYGSNNYTTPTGIYFDKDNLTPTTGVHGADKFDFATLLFPNPSSSGLVNVQLTGNVPELDMYQVIDLQGRIVQSGNVDTNEGLLQIQMGKQVPNGQYILQVLDNKKQTLVTESFVLEQ